MGREKVAVVDGSNVAYEEQTKGGKPKVSNLVAVRRALEERGYHPIVIVDASLHHVVDDPPQLEALLDRQEVR
ncbi:MAG: Zc3h12a-like ribonuclease, partial [Thermomicrobiaceae bacterium]|nr:Zc3h12a-like ribonuclease [Thermomicrobiaceae bacterium]